MRILLGVCVGAVALAIAALWLVGSFLASPAPAKLGPPPPGFLAIEFESPSGAMLRAWIAPVRGARAAAVLMHPLRGSRRSMLGRARLMNKLGVAALAFDFSAHGESTGDNISFGYHESVDARAALDYARQRWPDLPLIAVGVSLGGVAALLAEPPLDVEGMILESVFPDIATAVANRLAMRLPYGELAAPLLLAQLPLRLGIDPQTIAPVIRAESVTIPVLVLAGSRDQRTTVADTQRLYAAFPGPKQVLFFEGARHQNLQAFNRAGYDAVVSAFVGELLDGLK